MRFTQLPNLRVEDFTSEQDWIGRLFVQLNPFIQAVNQIFQNNIDFATNIKSITRNFSQTIITFQPFDFAWPYKDLPPSRLDVIQATKGSQALPTILLAAWSFDASTSLVRVTKILEVSSESGVTMLRGQYSFTIRLTV